MQYIWEMEKEYLNKLKWIKKILFKISNIYLKKWDIEKAKQYKNSKIIYNSHYTQKTCKKLYWWSNWQIIYPKIETIFLKIHPQENILNYYIFVWRVVKFAKELDKIIQLFSTTWDNLLIIWNWPDKNELIKKSNKNIIFIDFIKNKQKLANIIKKSKWLINITKESFWLATAEALSMWVPVFWYWKWWTLELMWLKNEINEITKTDFGVLVPNKDINTLKNWFFLFKKTHFDRKKIKDNFLKIYNKNTINNINLKYI